RATGCGDGSGGSRALRRQRGRAVITVVAVSGLAIIQDGGRHGRMHEGVPPGGALGPELLACANAAVGNDDDEAAIELYGAIALEGPRGTAVAGDGGTADGLGERSPTEPWRLACAGARVRYVAVRGGVDVPMVLGGRGTLLAGGFGGHEGRPLRRGDTLRAGGAPVDGVGVRGATPHGAQGQRETERRSVSDPIGVVPGPDIERFGPE